MRSIRIVGFCLLFVVLLSLTACKPPEGYSTEHYTYEDALAYAKAIDPDAVVSEICMESPKDILNFSDKEWNAVINGVECHVGSVVTYYGEYAWPYYTLATDYDYCLAEKILAEKQPQWQITEGNVAYPFLYRYGRYHDIMIKTSHTEAMGELSDEELEQLWKDICEIAAAYEEYSYKCGLEFRVVSPFVSMDSEIEMGYCFIWRFTEEAKQEFFARYREGWDLLESGLPVVD
jgi:hypothetical protein